MSLARGPSGCTHYGQQPSRDLCSGLMGNRWSHEEQMVQSWEFKTVLCLYRSMVRTHHSQLALQRLKRDLHSFQLGFKTNTECAPLGRDQTCLQLFVAAEVRLCYGGQEPCRCKKSSVMTLM